MNSIRLEMNRNECSAVLKVEGDLRSQDVFEFKEGLVEALTNSDSCILDLDSVTFIDQSCLHLLKSAQMGAKHLNKSFVIRDEPSGVLKKALELNNISWFE